MVTRISEESGIRPSSLEFLSRLKKNNNREWFNAHKDQYLDELQAVELFADGLLRGLGRHDLIETPSGKDSLHRIYRDTRFSSDKTPYKTRWHGSFRRATKFRRGGYHFNIEKGNSFVAGGFWAPVPADLRRIREDIAFDPAPIKKILKSKAFVSLFGVIKGEQLKTAPKGFDAHHEAIDLLRHKQFLLIRPFSDKEVLDRSFVKEAGLTFKGMRPFFDYMSEVLAGDGNGAII